MKSMTSFDYEEPSRRIIQIVQRHAKVDIDNKEQTTASKEGIYYLDANNMYGGVMHWMIPYELVGYINENRWWRRSIEIQSNGWVKSLNTFDKYRYFI